VILIPELLATGSSVQVNNATIPEPTDMSDGNNSSIARSKSGGAASWIGRMTGSLRGLMNRCYTALVDDGNPKVITQVMQDSNPRRYLDPTVVGRFGLSPLIAARVVEGFISGLHQSPFHGFSVEFADHREYVPGDDLRFIDWYLYARTDHYYIKRYREETNLRCHILLDCSASMAFGTAGLTKWDYSCFLASCLAYLMIKQQDAVGLSLFGDRPAVLVPPRSHGAHLNQIMRTMIRHPPVGRTNFSRSLLAILRNIKRRGLVVLISDLIDDPDETLKSIRLMAAHKHDVIVFHVQDLAETAFNFDGSTLFRDLETNEEMEVDPAVVRDSYVERVQSLIRFYQKGLTEMGIDYQPLDTRQPYDHALRAYLDQRASLRK